MQRSSTLRRHTGVHAVVRGGESHVFPLEKVACAAALPVEAGNTQVKPTFNWLMFSEVTFIFRSK